ncbi:MAG: hypothetical protein M1821_005767 [Bathelium mastoideum]|nr:MAG: hypothetical protein M1821_005767 [Bathelium mastoideum]
MNGRKGRPWSYRAENIPARTTIDDLLNFFEEEDRNFVTIQTLAPAASSSNDDDDANDLTATLSFAAVDATSRPPRLKVGSRITLDQTFYGLTPLNRPKHPINADIIAITGLAGHAYGSWATQDGFLWLRDALPLDFPHARVLTYGYPSQIHDNEAKSVVTDYAGAFVQRILIMREAANCKDRPLVLIGHSLGCLIIKQALIHAWDIASIPVRCVVFLGAPHRGLEVTALKTPVKSTPSENIIRELEPDSPTLNYLNELFSNVIRGTRIISCYEKHPTPTIIWRNGKWERDGPKVLMVAERSAVTYFPQETRIPVFSNHKEIAKIKRGEGSIYYTLQGAIKSAIQPPLPPTSEPKISSAKIPRAKWCPKPLRSVQPWPEHGLEADFNGQNTHLDVVAIHGLAGDLYSTWTDSTCLGLRDFLAFGFVITALVFGFVIFYH